MQLKDIEGQEVLANRLTEIIDSGRVGHAQLFLGPTSSGSLALAIAYAQYLCCEHPIGGDSCGQCPSCRKYRDLVHPDLHLVFPTATTSTVTSKPCSDDFQEEFRQFLADTHQKGTEDDWYAHLGIDNKQGMIRERDADNIVRTLALKPYEGGYKVLIIWMAERMNLECANKLLKTLEEPADKTLLILVAESRDRMLQTILSRVQQTVVPDLGTDLDPDRRASFATLFVSWMRLLFKLNMQQLSAWVDQVAVLGREQQKQLLHYAQDSLRACFLKSAAGHQLTAQLQFGDEKFDTFFPTMITPNNVEQMMQAMTGALYAIERNANAKITFMQLSFTLSKSLKSK